MVNFLGLGSGTIFFFKKFLFLDADIKIFTDEKSQKEKCKINE